MSVETSNSKSEHFDIPWTPGPWYTSGSFRVIQASVPKDHPLQDWPDCNPDVDGGPFCCDDFTCNEDDKAFCRDEWENCTPIATIARLPNPPGMTQGDQVIGHPQVKANIDLITLAPDMASVILAWREAHGDVMPEDPILRDVWTMADEIKTCGERPF